MKSILAFIFTVVMIASACKQKNASGKEAAEKQKKEEAVQNTAKDSGEIRKAVTEFYTWYNGNYEKFMKYDLCSGVKKADTPPYKINWDEVEKYQSFIRTSVSQLGEEFLKNQKQFFQQCDSAFKKDTEDEIPYGFDYDWYTNSQEDPKYLVDEITKAENWWEIVVNGNDAAVAIKGYYDNNGKKEPNTYLNLAMKKENGQWKISKIGTE
jgi:hypothetical protein